MSLTRPSDRIELRGLRVSTRCGVLPEEQQRAQPFRFDIDVFVDLGPAGASDDLADTVDYGALSATIVNTVEAERYQLLERLAQRVADLVLDDQRVVSVAVTATKLRPPVAEHLDTSGVRIERTRST